MAVDPITLSVFQFGLQQVCDEMDLSFSRAAFSPVIAEQMIGPTAFIRRRWCIDCPGAGGLPVLLAPCNFQQGSD